MHYFGDAAGWYFLTLSGYLITKSLIRDKSPDFWGEISRFYQHRVLRIFPAYYVVMTVLLAVNFLPCPLLFYTFTYNFEIFAHAKLDQYCHLWTICVQEQFYLIIPWIVLSCSTRTTVTILCLMVISSPIIQSIISSNLPGTLPNVLLCCADKAMAIGCLIAFFEAKGPKVKPYMGTISFVLGIIMMVIYGVRIALIGESHSLILDISMALTIYGLATTRNQPLINTLSVQPLRYLGKISYMMYLVHNFYFVLAPYLRGKFYYAVTPDWINIPVAAVLTLLTGILSWQFFEYPILKLKKYHSKKEAKSDSEQKPNSNKLKTSANNGAT